MDTITKRNKNKIVLLQKEIFILMLYKNFAFNFQECYGVKIKGIHILNAPPFIDRIVFLLKLSLKEKVASRVHVHNSYEDLHKHIPKEILPKEYDGDEESCSKLVGE